MAEEHSVSPPFCTTAPFRNLPLEHRSDECLLWARCRHSTKHALSGWLLRGPAISHALIVLSGSPLFNGGASSGESEIRRWLLENDLVEAIVALPTEIFFRTGIGTYLWILSNKKDGRRGKRVQLINATGFWSSIKNEGIGVALHL